MMSQDSPSRFISPSTINLGGGGPGMGMIGGHPFLFGGGGPKTGADVGSGNADDEDVMSDAGRPEDNGSPLG
jgi:hypothetical protein